MFSTSLIKSDDLALRTAKVLKELGVKPDQPDNLNQTPLYYAAREGKLNLSEFLIAEGNCNVNNVDTYGQSPIFYASREGHIDMVKKLVGYGADADLIDNNGQTPIYYAIKGNRVDIVDYLLSTGVSTTTVDKKGVTPFAFAKKINKVHILDVLRKYNALPENDLAKQGQSKKQSQVQAAAAAAPQPAQIAKKVNERKIPKRYQLTVLRDGQYEPLSDEDWTKFCDENPELSKLFLADEDTVVEPETSIETLEVPEVGEQAPIYDSWDKAAKRLMNSLWKHNQAWIFYEPVDPKKLNIPDYYDIIKQPMDFGTVKSKLHANQYFKCQEFLYELNLVFDNCIQYNGESSQVSIMCKGVRDEFNKLYYSLCMDFY